MNCCSLVLPKLEIGWTVLDNFGLEKVSKVRKYVGGGTKFAGSTNT